MGNWLCMAAHILSVFDVSKVDQSGVAFEVRGLRVLRHLSAFYSRY